MVALEFVLNLDELIFEAIAPLSIKKAVCRVAPLPCVQIPTCRGLDVFAIGNTMFVILCTCGLAFGVLGPQTKELNNAINALCVHAAAPTQRQPALVAPAQSRVCALVRAGWQHPFRVYSLPAGVSLMEPYPVSRAAAAHAVARAPRRPSQLPGGGAAWSPQWQLRRATVPGLLPG